MRRWDDHPAGSELRYQARVEPVEIGYVCMLTEAHEGLAVVRTKDEALGIVEFWVPPAMRADFESFLEALGREIPIRFSPAAPMDLADLQELQ